MEEGQISAGVGDRLSDLIAISSAAEVDMGELRRQARACSIEAGGVGEAEERDKTAEDAGEGEGDDGIEGAEAAPHPQLRSNTELAEVLMTALGLFIWKTDAGQRGHGRENS